MRGFVIQQYVKGCQIMSFHMKFGLPGGNTLASVCRNRPEKNVAPQEVAIAFVVGRAGPASVVAPKRGRPSEVLVTGPIRAEDAACRTRLRSVGSGGAG